MEQPARVAPVPAGLPVPVHPARRGLRLGRTLLPGLDPAFAHDLLERAPASPSGSRSQALVQGPVHTVLWACI